MRRLWTRRRKQDLDSQERGNGGKSDCACLLLSAGRPGFDSGIVNAGSRAAQTVAIAPSPWPFPLKGASPHGHTVTSPVYAGNTP